MLTIENTNSDLNVHSLHYANDCLNALDFPFKNSMDYRTFGKRVKSVLVVDKSTDHDKPYFDFYVFVFDHNIDVKENVFF